MSAAHFAASERLSLPMDVTAVELNQQNASRRLVIGAIMIVVACYLAWLAAAHGGEDHHAAADAAHSASADHGHAAAPSQHPG